MALTDALRNDEELEMIEMDADMQALAEVVHGLHKLMPPEQEASPQLRTRLTRELGDEYDKVQRQRKVVQIGQQRFIRLASVAAAVVMIMAVGLVLSSSGNNQQEGTAAGAFDSNTLIIMGVVTAGIMVAGAFVLFKQKQKDDK